MRNNGLTPRAHTRLAQRMRITEMTAAFAAEMTSWSYPEPYQCYDLAGADPAYFTDPANGFVALVDDDGALIGYRSFGPDGQVPGGAYECACEGACEGMVLDTGGGLRPDLTGLGRGLGREAIATGLAYGRATFRPAVFRVTVATFNTRARRVVESLGFRQHSSFAATTDGRRFDILLLPCTYSERSRGGSG